MEYEGLLLHTIYYDVRDTLNNGKCMLVCLEDKGLKLTHFNFVKYESINSADIRTYRNKLGLPFSFKMKIWANAQFDAPITQIYETDIFFKDVNSIEDIVSKILHLLEQSNKDFKRNKLKYDDSLRQYNLFKEGTE